MIYRVEDLKSINLTSLVSKSEEEGYGMVKRLVEDYTKGVNKFDGNGEALFVCKNPMIQAIGGINIESSNEYQGAGRIRRVYVLPSVRGTGVGRMIIESIIAHSIDRFELLTCNVGPLESWGFYERLGFKRVSKKGITHIYEMPNLLYSK